MNSFKPYLFFTLLLVIVFPKHSSAQTIQLVPGLSAFSDYEKGLEQAKSQQKQTLIYFYDKASANCRKFETNIFSDESVKNYLNKKFIVICLLVVDKTPLLSSKTSTKTGKSLKTVGEYNYDIEKYSYNNDSQPFCVLLDSQSNFIKGKEYTSEPKDFLKFLKTSK